MTPEAAALAERRALEACAEVLALTMKHKGCCVMAPGWWFPKAVGALAADDAARQARAEALALAAPRGKM